MGIKGVTQNLKYKLPIEYHIIFKVITEEK